MLDQLWTVVFETTLALRKCTGSISTSLISDKEHSCMVILTNCLVDAHAAVQSMRSGFHRASAIMARGMLENMALAVAMKSDESDSIFKQYMSDKYDIPKAVSVANNQFPFFGENLWYFIK